jgi:DNA primase
VEYQLTAIAKKYNLSIDDERVKFIQEAADLISTLGSPVQREIYGHRIAEAGKISFEAMQSEIGKAYKRRQAREKKKQEKIDLQPAQARQPQSRTIRYENLKSAMAEESILAYVLREPALFGSVGTLAGKQFSVELLGRVFDALLERYRQGLDVSLGVLPDLTPEEMSHLASVFQSQSGPVNEDAFRDCVRTIQREYQSGKVESDEDIRALMERMKKSKGYKA